MEEKINFKNKITDWWIKWTMKIKNFWFLEKRIFTK
jgi:hypothetical protein